MMDFELVADPTVPVYQGLLQKRCSFCWRPRHVELYCLPSGAQKLEIYHPKQKKLMQSIRMENVVTIRANKDCHFQVYMTDDKILEFKTESLDVQACWMAVLKVGLGKGNIFHVRVNTPTSQLEHALMYSVGVNRPPQRAGSLDQILVLSSPINDIIIQAWDLDRVLRFIELDIGIRLVLCPSCAGSQSGSTTLVIGKQSIKSCIQFLCREVKISEVPRNDGGIFVYDLKHTCGVCSPPAIPAPKSPSELPPPYHPTEVIPPPVSDQKEATPALKLPPRTIPRVNYESSIPAIAQPYLNYFPHWTFDQSRTVHFEGPYQISSRIIITDSGDVKYEPTVLGNLGTKPMPFDFGRKIPLPPRHSARKVEVQTQVQCQQQPDSSHDRLPSPGAVTVTSTESDEYVDIRSMRQPISTPPVTCVPPTPKPRKYFRYPRVELRGDDQAGLVDHEETKPPSIPPKKSGPKPIPRRRSKTTRDSGMQIDVGVTLTSSVIAESRPRSSSITSFSSIVELVQTPL